MNEPLFITDINGKQVEVTDFDEAIQQAEKMVTWHRNQQEAKEKDPTVHYLPQAHAEWEHIFSQLTKHQQWKNLLTKIL